MKGFKILFITAIFLLPKISFGCSCTSPTTFCESITSSTGDIRPNIIVRGFIEGTSGNREININHVMYGELNKNKIIVDNGFCTLFYNELENNQEYIFALNINEDRYSLLNCAISFLKIENNVIKGKIAPGIESINYFEFNTIEACGINFDIINLKNEITLFPNPTKGIICLKVNELKSSFENYDINIFDLLGRKLFNHKKLEGFIEKDIWTINIQDIPSGVYIIRLSNKNQECSYRIVKE